MEIKGQWAYLYRAVDKEGQTVDFLLTPQRDREAAGAFLRKASRQPGLPEKIALDQRGANTAAIKRDNKTQKTAVIIRHSKYLIAVCICMHPRSLAVQPERSEAKSKAGPPTLRLRRWRGYAQSERENNPGCTRVKTAISHTGAPGCLTRVCRRLPTAYACASLRLRAAPET